MREAATSTGRVGVKVWLYKGDILPYKPQGEDKASKEAAMAVGESTGKEATPRVVSSRPPPPNAGDAADEGTEEPAPLLKEADPEFEKLLTEEEEIERQAQSRSKGPEHFRPNEGE